MNWTCFFFTRRELIGSIFMCHREVKSTPFCSFCHCLCTLTFHYSKVSGNFVQITPLVGSWRPKRPRFSTEKENCRNSWNCLHWFFGGNGERFQIQSLRTQNLSLKQNKKNILLLEFVSLLFQAPSFACPSCWVCLVLPSMKLSST